MGIAAKTASSSISDEVAMAVENALKNKNTEETETKVVRAESKKSVSADDGEPKVQVKAAKVVKAATPKKSQPKTDKKSESAPVRKAPIGRPITKAEAESRRRPAGTPITKKEKAEKEKDIVITGYTHTQPAQPITMGYYYSAVLEALERDFTRLQAAYINTNRCPYGAAAFAGASFPLDREMLAKLLGFDEVLENALDCIASKDFLLETEMAFSNLAVTLSRVAQDLYMWSTDEFGLLDVGGEVAVCSSIMPQKKNPAGLEYVKAKAAHPIGALMGCLASLKNIPFSNNIDIHEALWFFEESFNETRKVIGMMTECLKYSKINEDTAYNRAASNYSTVTGLADTLVKRCGLSFREAHHIVGSMVLETIESKQGIAGMTGALLSEISREFLGREICLSDEEIKNVLEPRNNIESKETFGGPQQASVSKMLLRSADKLNEEKAWYGEVVQRLESASAFMREEEAAIRNN